MCLFCKIVNNEILSTKIYEDDTTIAILDIDPISDGHLLLIPKKHLDDYMKANSSYLISIQNCLKILEEKLQITGYSIITNGGVNQEVKHLHFHIIPNNQEHSNVVIKKQATKSLETIYNILK